MAVIKIQRSNRQVAQFQETPTSAAALPVFQIGNQVEAGFTAIGNSIKRLLIMDIDNPENITAIDTAILGFYGTNIRNYFELSKEKVKFFSVL